MDISIIHEDQDIWIINKPAGLVVNQAKTVSEPTLQDWLKEKLADEKAVASNELVPGDFDDSFGTPEEIFTQRLGLVHRLDKNTSGVLILAKNPGALVNLLAQFKKRQIEKKYVCLTHGKFRVPAGTINAPLGRMSADRQKFAVVSSGRPAVTRYEVQEFYSGFSDQGKEQLKKSGKKISLYQGFSLVYCWPKTGRTHQIRVHMKHWKHPLVGDGKYVGKRRAKLDALWCPRQFLHAAEIKFTHPRSGEEASFKVELSQDLKEVLKFLQP
ncbi:RluA family pseudouridine synthase [Patescibacteria group bacterium]|nr:RluA family pseudouridine synthase [Patescibacteria group bacterium]MBU1885018.1 RluA family pseudouridine synthase [Patescibacteria group bacterium]